MDPRRSIGVEWNSRSDVARAWSFCTYTEEDFLRQVLLAACLPASHVDWGEGLSLPETFKSFASFDPGIY